MRILLDGCGLGESKCINMADDTGGLESQIKPPGQGEVRTKPAEGPNKPVEGSKEAGLVGVLGFHKGEKKDDPFPDPDRSLLAVGGPEKTGINKSSESAKPGSYIADEDAQIKSGAAELTKKPAIKGKVRAIVNAAIIAAAFAYTPSVQAESIEQGSQNVNSQIVEKQVKNEERESLGKKINSENSYGSNMVPLELGNASDAVERVKKEGGFDALLEKGRGELEESMKKLTKKIPEAGWKTNMFVDAAMTVTVGTMDRIVSEKIREGMLESLQDPGKRDAAKEYLFDERNPDNMMFKDSIEKRHWKITYGADPENKALGVNLELKF